MQIVRSGKVSRLHNFLGKTLAIVQQFETPYNRKKTFAGKPSRLEANPRKPRKLSTANDLHYTVYWNFVCSVTRRVGFVHKFICRKPAVMPTNDQRLTNLYESVVFHIQLRLVLFSGPLKPQAGSFNR